MINYYVTDKIHEIRDTALDVFYFLLRKFLKPVVSIVWMKDVVGLENIPKKGGVILAINHQSYFDFICLAVMSPRNVHFLAAEKFFDHWLWRHLMKTTRQVRVDRVAHDKSQMHQAIHSHLEDGKVVGFFPEGTRSPHEHEMLKAFSGVAQYSIAKKIPIIPVGLRGTFSVMSRHDKRPHFTKNVEIHVGHPIHFEEYYNRRDLTSTDYHIVTHKVMKEISFLSNKKYIHELQ